MLQSLTVLPLRSNLVRGKLEALLGVCMQTDASHRSVVCPAFSLLLLGPPLWWLRLLSFGFPPFMDPIFVTVLVSLNRSSPLSSCSILRPLLALGHLSGEAFVAGIGRFRFGL